MSRSLLLFSEDPGATQCLLPLLPLLEEGNHPYRILAAGVASGIYERKGYHPEPVPEMDSLFDRDRPALLLTGTAANPDSAGLHLIAAARLRGITSVGVVDGLMNAARRFSGRSESPLAHAPDWIAVADEPTALRYRAFGADPGRVVVTGHPHYDTVLREAKRLHRTGGETLRKKHFPAIEAERKLLLFATEPESHLCRDADYRLHGRGGREGRVAIVMEEFQDALAALSPRPAAALLLHPRNAPDDFGPLAGEFDLCLQGGDVHEILCGADAVCGLSTMLLTEALLLRRPALSILPREEEKDWVPGIGWGVMDCVTDR
ncbi:MAG: hypothetical protein HQL31_04020, partial [Planctomycetes bacterium]|nr:hypothetical protein [Planctomycetota bacterium]